MSWLLQLKIFAVCNDSIGGLHHATNVSKLVDWCVEALKSSLASLVYFVCVVCQCFSTFLVELVFLFSSS